MTKKPENAKPFGTPLAWTFDITLTTVIATALKVIVTPEFQKLPLHTISSFLATTALGGAMAELYMRNHNADHANLLLEKGEVASPETNEQLKALYCTSAFFAALVGTTLASLGWAAAHDYRQHIKPEQQSDPKVEKASSWQQRTGNEPKILAASWEDWAREQLAKESAAKSQPPALS